MTRIEVLMELFHTLFSCKTHAFAPLFTTRDPGQFFLEKKLPECAACAFLRERLAGMGYFLLKA